MSKTLAERFWSKVLVTPTCWLWTANRTPTGYGLFSMPRPDGRLTSTGAHRAAYRLLVGPIPGELEIDHLCKVRRCVNPAHLEPVTRRENLRRRETETKTHCIRGHPLFGDNLYVRPGNSTRCCRECQRIRNRQAAARSKTRRYLTAQGVAA
jgi:hypothetical protein